LEVVCTGLGSGGGDGNGDGGGYQLNKRTFMNFYNRQTNLLVSAVVLDKCTSTKCKIAKHHSGMTLRSKTNPLVLLGQNR
jgi:hypothetical protein